MSYCIEYNPELKKRYPNTYKKRREIPIKPLLISLLLMVAVYITFSGGLLKFIIPGDDGVTVEAFSQLVSSVREGVSIKDSVISFCKDIILGGR